MPVVSVTAIIAHAVVAWTLARVITIAQPPSATPVHVPIRPLHLSIARAIAQCRWIAPASAAALDTRMIAVSVTVTAVPVRRTAHGQVPRLRSARTRLGNTRAWFMRRVRTRPFAKIQSKWRRVCRLQMVLMDAIIGTWCHVLPVVTRDGVRSRHSGGRKITAWVVFTSSPSFSLQIEEVGCGQRCD